MTRRRMMRWLYNTLDSVGLRRVVQKIALKIAILEIEDEN